MLCLPLFGCGPSCEEQGGKVVQHGDFYVWQWIDMQKGIGYMQPYPNYVCLKEKNSQ
jgi:hypothetical protein